SDFPIWKIPYIEYQLLNLFYFLSSYYTLKTAYNQLLKKSSVGERPAARGGTTRPDERPHHKLFFE
ncbi:hypothetical protein O1428_21425, partial [Bacteroides fragilis]